MRRLPGPLRHSADVAELLLPGELPQPVQLRQYFSGKKPVVIQLGYYGCPMLCDLVSRGLTQSVKPLELAGTPHLKWKYFIYGGMVHKVNNDDEVGALFEKINSEKRVVYEA
mgnify:CR=1 FL=1